MKPPRSILRENFVPIDVSGFHLRDGGMTTVRTTECCANPETPLGKIQPVANASANPVIRHPTQVFLAHASLQHKVFHETPNRVVSECRHNRRVHTKTTFESTGNVVLASTFPHAKLTGCRYAVVARIEPEHNFSEAHQVPHAFVFRSDL